MNLFISIGNLSNPLINRWGLNLFWYKLWFKDKTPSLVFHQDRIFEKFISIYVHYGLLFPKTFWFSKYWTTPYWATLLSDHRNNSARYFRLVEFKSKMLNQRGNYKVRLGVKNLHFSRLWVMRYQGWVIFYLHCFQPFTGRQKYFNKSTRAIDLVLPTPRSPLRRFKRWKFSLYYFLSLTFVKQRYYSF